MPCPVIFLDKDGTIIEDVPYNVDPGKIVLVPGAQEAIDRLSSAGFSFIVITNQPGVAYGRFAEEALQEVRTRLYHLICGSGAVLLDFYYCPHHPNGVIPQYTRRCLCRKPSPGLLHKAVQEHDIDMSASWFIGDILDDVEAGNRAGVRTILLNNGHETLWEPGLFRIPERIVCDLKEAAAYIASV